MRFCYFDCGAVCRPRPPAGAKRRRREWVSEGKEPGGLFSRSDTPQSRELKAQSMIATRNDHATGEGKQTSPSGLGRLASLPQARAPERLVSRVPWNKSPFLFLDDDFYAPLVEKSSAIKKRQVKTCRFFSTLAFYTIFISVEDEQQLLFLKSMVASALSHTLLF